MTAALFEHIAPATHHLQAMQLEYAATTRNCDRCTENATHTAVLDGRFSRLCTTHAAEFRREHIAPKANAAPSAAQPKPTPMDKPYKKATRSKKEGKL